MLYLHRLLMQTLLCCCTYVCMLDVPFFLSAFRLYFYGWWETLMVITTSCPMDASCPCASPLHCTFYISSLGHDASQGALNWMLCFLFHLLWRCRVACSKSHYTTTTTGCEPLTKIECGLSIYPTTFKCVFILKPFLRRGHGDKYIYNTCYAADPSVCSP